MLATDNVALAVPAAVGLKVTDTVQVRLAASPAVQVFVWAKLAAFVPVRLTDETVRVPVPVFFNVTVCAALVAPTVVEAKVSALGVRVPVTVTGATPVPVNAAVRVVAPVAATDNEAVEDAAVLGANVSDTVQV